MQKLLLKYLSKFPTSDFRLSDATSPTISQLNCRSIRHNYLKIALERNTATFKPNSHTCNRS